MLFPTIDFGLFFAFSFALVWGLNSYNTLKKVVLLALSLAFYASWNWRFLLLLLASGAISYRRRALCRRESAPPLSPRRARARRRARSGHSRLFQIPRLLHRAGAQARPCAGARPAARLRQRHAAGGDLVPDLSRDFLHRRRLSRPAGGLALAARHRALHQFLPASGRGADRARARVPAAARFAAESRRFLLRREHAADPRRPVQEDGDRQLSRGALRRSGLHRPDAILALRSDRRGLRLRDPDLRRFLRLHRHRDRRGGAARLSLSAEFQSALSRARHRRFLAPLAHDAVEVAARLSLYSAWAATATARWRPRAISC